MSMKLISVSSLLYYVTDIAKTREFYEAIGFQFDDKGDKVVTYVNWFSIELRESKDVKPSDGSGYAYIKVDSVEELQKRLASKGIKQQGEPTNVGGGVTELQVRDPDGYRLTFFQKK